MRLGQAAMEALRAEITGCLQPGDELAVVCPVGLKGTSIIADRRKRDWQSSFLPGLFITAGHFSEIMELEKRYL